jgi:hypothetical protein
MLTGTQAPPFLGTKLLPTSGKSSSGPMGETKTLHTVGILYIQGFQGYTEE